MDFCAHVAAKEDLLALCSDVPRTDGASPDKEFNVNFFGHLRRRLEAPAKASRRTTVLRVPRPWRDEEQRGSLTYVTQVTAGGGRFREDGAALLIAQPEETPMEAVKPNKVGIVFALLYGGWHTLWAILVGVGFAQPLLNFVF